MSDDLIKQLRTDADYWREMDPERAYTFDRSADRIGELEERLKAAQDDAKEAETYTEELEANLAKALSALEVGIAKHDGAEKFLKDARTTLAEIQGEQR